MKYSVVKSIQNEQSSFRQWIIEVPKIPRYWLGLVACAAIAWCACPFLGNLLTLGQYGVRDLNNALVDGIVISVLMLANLLGSKLKIDVAFGAILTALALLWCIYTTATRMPVEAWNAYTDIVWWGISILFGLVPLLNAALFTQYKKLVDLE